MVNLSSAMSVTTLKPLVFIQLIGLLTIAGCTNPSPPEKESKRSVVTYQVSNDPVHHQSTYSGILRASQRAELSFQVAGLIVEMNMTLGDQFQRGDVLAKINSTERLLEVAQQMANLTEAQADQNYAQLTLQRLTTLKGTDAASQADFDLAKARLEAANARIIAIKAMIGLAQKRLSETTLSAPFDGEIVEQIKEVSQVVAAGEPLYRVIGDDHGLEAVVNLPVAALANFKTGSITQINVLPMGLKRPATVIEVGNAANASGLYPITLQLADPSGLRSGLRVEVLSPDSQTLSSNIIIPLTAYRAATATSGSVFLVDKTTGVVTEHAIKLGDIGDNGIAVLDGLKSGDLIIAKGLAALRDGDQVQVLSIDIKRFND